MKQRITETVNFLIFSKIAADKTDLARKLGYNNSSFSQIINGRVPASDRFLKRLCELCPDLNYSWLSTGEGTMLRGNGQQVVGDYNTTVHGNSNNVNSETARFIALLEKKDEQIDRLLSIIENQTNGKEKKY